jgi:hypothetical protein
LLVDFEIHSDLCQDCPAGLGAPVFAPLGHRQRHPHRRGRIRFPCFPCCPLGVETSRYQCPLPTRCGCLLCRGETEHGLKHCADPDVDVWCACRARVERGDVCALQPPLFRRVADGSGERVSFCLPDECMGNLSDHLSLRWIILQLNLAGPLLAVARTVTGEVCIHGCSNPDLR